MGFLGVAWAFLSRGARGIFAFIISRPWYQIVIAILAVILVWQHLSHGREVRSLQSTIAKKTAVIAARDQTIANYKAALVTSEASVKKLTAAVNQQNADIDALHAATEKAHQAALAAIKAANVAAAKATANVALLRSTADELEDCRAPAAHLKVMEDL